MLDADLARIYGYTTKAFNQQVKNNLEKFEGEDFMFQPTKEELEKSFSHRDSNLKSSFLTSSFLTSSFLTSSWGGIRKLPYAFTEQGIYMLMTVLHGELAVKQSRALVVAFKAMKDYLLENRSLISEREQLKMMTLIAEDSQHMQKIEEKITVMDRRLVDVEAKAESAVLKSEISPIILDFNRLNDSHEYLFMNGELLEAKEAYQDIYSRARKSIYIIDV